MKIKLYFTVYLFLFSCGNTKTNKTNDFLTLKNIGELATIEMKFKKIIEVKDDNTWYKFGDRAILISCKATVKAGIDFSTLSNNAVTVDHKIVTIQLPKPILLTFNMNPRDIQVLSTNINGFRTNFTQYEKNELLKLGEKSIRNDLSKSNLISKATENTNSFIEKFYKNLGFEKVLISYY